MKIQSLSKMGKISAGIVLIVVLVLFAVPRLAKIYIVRNSNELIGRQLEIDKIRFNYFTGTLKIINLKLYEDNSASVFVSFKKFKINIDYLPLLSNEILVQSINLDNLYLQILQDGERFNFSTLGATSETDTSDSDTASAEVMKYILKNIQISNSYVKYTDVPLDHTIELNKVDLIIPGFAWNSDSTNLAVDFRFVEGGGLYSKLELNNADSTYSVNLKLDSLNLNILKPYIESSLDISDIRGYFSNDIIIKGSTSHIMQLSVEGINQISDFRLTDNQKRDILTFRNFTIDIESFLLESSTVKLRSVSLNEPTVFFELIDTTNNWMTLMKPSENIQSDTIRAANDTAEKSNQGSFTCKSFTITEGFVSFSDKTLRYPFNYTVERIYAESQVNSDNPDIMEMNLSALLNGTGRFTTNAILNLNDFTDLNMKLSVKQLSMKDFDAYFKHYFGYPVQSGKLNFSTSNRLKSEELNSENNIDLRKFYLEKQIEGTSEFSFPLRLALGVLSDKDGIINMNVPVEMRGEDVKIRNIGKIVFKTIGNLFVKAATSPYNILAGSYSIDPGELKEVNLDLFNTEISGNGLKSLDVLADILSKKPGINVVFYHCANRQMAGDSLAYIIASDNYKAATNSNIVSDSLLVSFIANQNSVPVADLKIMCRNYIGEENISQQLDSIKNWQIGFLTRYLGEEKALDNNRFKIYAETPDTISTKSKGASFKVYFTADESGR